VTQSKPKILGASLQNLVARATWRPGILHPGTHTISAAIHSILKQYTLTRLKENTLRRHYKGNVTDIITVYWTNLTQPIKTVSDKLWSF